MKYLLMLFQSPEYEAEWEAMDDAARAAVLQEFETFTAEAERRGVQILGGYELALSHTATTLRRTARTGGGDDVVVTDGPYAEVAEHLGGYFEVEARDLDHVLEVARFLPVGTTEIRPILDHEAEGAEP
jgi:hypothetical protein